MTVKNLNSENKLQKHLPHELLYMHRTRTRLTQAELAKLLGLKSFRMIQYWEGGYSLPKAEKLRRLLELFYQAGGLVAGKELAEAKLLWQTVKDASEVRPDSHAIYPVFDEFWFKQLLTKPEVLPNDAPTTASTEIIVATRTGNTADLALKLPSQLTRFVGREVEQAKLLELLRQPHTRLITLTGPGGAGKTRLALEVARNLLNDFKDGCYFVGLASLTNPADVTGAIARSLDLPETTSGQNLMTNLQTFLRRHATLLVIDNFEHLIQAAAQLGSLLEAAPDLKILVTSREVLKLSGERQFELRPLDETAAQELFADRAQLVRPDFSLNKENRKTVAELCRRLDRLPLAIELAAARSRVFTPGALLNRLADRLDLAAVGSGAYLQHQKTLGSAIEWSYRLLASNEQKLFRSLTIFAGGVQLSTLQTIYQPESTTVGLEDLLVSLIDKSMLQQTVSASTPDDPRFIMLETLREYGRAKLSETDELAQIAEQHAIYFLQLAKDASNGIARTQQVAWLARVELEHANLLSAFSYLNRPEKAEHALQLAGALWRFWWVKGYLREGRMRLEWALALGRAAGLEKRPAYTVALGAAGTLAYLQGDYRAALEYHQQAADNKRETGDRQGYSTSLNGLGLVWRCLGDYEKARLLHLESLAIKQQTDDQLGSATCLNNLGIIAEVTGDYTEANKFHRKSLHIRQKFGDRQGVIHSLNNLGETAFLEEKLTEAEAFFEQALEFSREPGDNQARAYSVAGLAAVQRKKGRPESAFELTAEGLQLRYELGDRRGLVKSLLGLIGCRLELPDTDWKQCARLLAAAQKLVAEMGCRLDPFDEKEAQNIQTLLAERLSEAEIQLATFEGYNTEPAQLIEPYLNLQFT